MQWICAICDNAAQQPERCKRWSLKIEGAKEDGAHPESSGSDARHVHAALDLWIRRALCALDLLPREAPRGSRSSARRESDPEIPSRSLWSPFAFERHSMMCKLFTGSPKLTIIP